MCCYGDVLLFPKDGIKYFLLYSSTACGCKMRLSLNFSKLESAKEMFGTSWSIHGDLNDDWTHISAFLVTFQFSGCGYAALGAAEPKWNDEMFKWLHNIWLWIGVAEDSKKLRMSKFGWHCHLLLMLLVFVSRPLQTSQSCSHVVHDSWYWPSDLCWILCECSINSYVQVY